ncbi:MAG TPA: nicotinate-nucleotide adenylyltransferase, partial [Anaerolineaceae bacterium]|nr:nicotinate-nucleotide adenylyltransferase [Anaerolineaceae bacterium]
PHIGHLILAAEAREQLNLDRLLWMLTPDPPHKQGRVISPMEVRREMVCAAIAENPAFELSTVEIDRPGPHYAVDTVRIVQRMHPEASVLYLIGGDSLHDLPTWHEPARLVADCAALGVMRRPGDQIDLSALEQNIPGISAKVAWIDAPLLEISASEIRERVRNGQTYRYYLPESVFRLIQQHQLYQ